MAFRQLAGTVQTNLSTTSADVAVPLSDVFGDQAEPARSRVKAGMVLLVQVLKGSGAAMGYVKIGNGAQVADATGVPIAPNGGWCVFSVNPGDEDLHVAAVTDAGTAVLTVTLGSER